MPGLRGDDSDSTEVYVGARDALPEAFAVEFASPEELRTEVLRLRGLVVQLEEQNARLASENRAQERASTLLAGQFATFAQTVMLAPQPAPAPRSRSGVAVPDAFDGDRAKGQLFKEQCWLYVSDRPQEFPTDMSRIRFMLSYMKAGSASMWASNVTRELMSGRNVHPTFAAFEAEFDRHFVVADPAADAANKLDKIQQGSRPVEDFYSEFGRYANLSGYGPVELARKFKAGLRSATLEALYTLDPVPDTWTALGDAAMRKEQQWRERQALKASAPSRTPATAAAPSVTRANVPRQNAAPAPTTNREPDVKPMEVDRGRARAAGGHTRGACFDCGSTEHYRGDARCPQQIRLVEDIIRRIQAGTGPPAPAARTEPAVEQPKVFDETHV